MHAYVHNKRIYMCLPEWSVASNEFLNCHDFMSKYGLHECLAHTFLCQFTLPRRVIGILCIFMRAATKQNV